MKPYQRANEPLVTEQQGWAIRKKQGRGGISNELSLLEQQTPDELIQGFFSFVNKCECLPFQCCYISSSISVKRTDRGLGQCVYSSHAFSKSMDREAAGLGDSLLICPSLSKGCTFTPRGE